MKQYDLESVLGFAEKLKQNNNREWINSHRKEYEFARARFEVFVDDLIQELSKSEPHEGITSKDCIFRLNRDLRFNPIENLFSRAYSG